MLRADLAAWRVLEDLEKGAIDGAAQAVTALRSALEGE